MKKTISIFIGICLLSIECYSIDDASISSNYSCSSECTPSFEFNERTEQIDENHAEELIFKVTPSDDQLNILKTKLSSVNKIKFDFPYYKRGVDCVKKVLTTFNILKTVELSECMADTITVDVFTGFDFSELESISFGRASVEMINQVFVMAPNLVSVKCNGVFEVEGRDGFGSLNFPPNLKELHLDFRISNKLDPLNETQLVEKIIELKNLEVLYLNYTGISLQKQSKIAKKNINIRKMHFDMINTWSHSGNGLNGECFFIDGKYVSVEDCCKDFHQIDSSGWRCSNR